MPILNWCFCTHEFDNKYLLIAVELFKHFTQLLWNRPLQYRFPQVHLLMALPFFTEKICSSNISMKIPVCLSGSQSLYYFSLARSLSLSLTHTFSLSLSPLSLTLSFSFWLLTFLGPLFYIVCVWVYLELTTKDERKIFSVYKVLCINICIKSIEVLN